MRYEDLISIIVPIYNASKYINRCIESIVNQTYGNVEILLIDDGSSDNSSEICDEWECLDKRILAIHKQNGGVSSARNLGLEKAHGKYIIFVDADDWLEPDFLSCMLSKMSNCDCVIGAYNVIKNNVTIKKDIQDCIINIEELKNRYDFYLKNDILNPPFAKIFRKEIIKNQCFDETLSLGEDLAFNLQYMNKCSSISVVSDALYNYNMCNESSASKKLRNNDFEQVRKIYLLSKKFVGKENCIDYDEIDKRYCENVIGLLQLLLYSENPKKYETARQWISSSLFQECCNGNYEFGIVNRIPQLLCKKKLYNIIFIFFRLKKAMRSLKK